MSKEYNDKAIITRTETLCCSLSLCLYCFTGQIIFIRYDPSICFDQYAVIPMMFGFGDDESPLVETADALEELVIAYASGVLQESLDLASRRGLVKSNGKALGPPTAEDVMTVVRRDGKKSNRVEELLIMQREIKVIQEMEKTDEESLAKLVQ